MRTKKRVVIRQINKKTLALLRGFLVLMLTYSYLEHVLRSKH